MLLDWQADHLLIRLRQEAAIKSLGCALFVVLCVKGDFVAFGDHDGGSPVLSNADQVKVCRAVVRLCTVPLEHAGLTGAIACIEERHSTGCNDIVGSDFDAGDAILKTAPESESFVLDVASAARQLGIPSVFLALAFLSEVHGAEAHRRGGATVPRLHLVVEVPVGVAQAHLALFAVVAVRFAFAAEFGAIVEVAAVGRRVDNAVVELIEILPDRVATDKLRCLLGDNLLLEEHLSCHCYFVYCLKFELLCLRLLRNLKLDLLK